MQQLTAHIAAAPRKALPEPVAEITRHHLLDTLAAMVSGSRLPPGRMAVSYVKSLGGTREATVAGSRITTSAVNAAFANGMLAHADETDDAHLASMTHPGCGIVPVALAIAERGRSDGTALLRAVALGYDISARLAMALGAGEFRRVGHLPHCFGPTFGGAAAGAALAGFTPRQIRHVLSYAAQQASGLATYPRDRDHIEKAFDFGGMAARNAAAAVTLVAAGCTGVDDVFSGERNFFVAHDESARMTRRLDTTVLTRDLGKTHEIVNTNIKRWSAGLPIQAPLDSLLVLMHENTLRTDGIEHITVRVATTGARTTDNRDMPDICLQHLCAVLLIDGGLTFDSAHDAARMQDPQVLALRSRITLAPDEKLEKLRPESHGIVEIELKDGRHLRHHTRAVRGTAANRMTRAEVDGKCHALLAPVLGEKRARLLCNTVWDIERLRDARQLCALLRV